MDKLNLQMYTGYSLTIYKDGNVTTATAAKDSGLAKDEETVLTLVFSDGYELDEVEIISGGATFTPSTKKVKMGDADAVINVKSKKDNLYKVVESTYCCVNGTVTRLGRNMKLVCTANGAVADVSCAGTELSLNADIIAALVASGAIVKM